MPFGIILNHTGAESKIPQKHDNRWRCRQAVFQVLAENPLICDCKLFTTLSCLSANVYIVPICIIAGASYDCLIFTQGRNTVVRAACYTNIRPVTCPLPFQLRKWWSCWSWWWWCWWWGCCWWCWWWGCCWWWWWWWLVHNVTNVTGRRGNP